MAEELTIEEMEQVGGGFAPFAPLVAILAVKAIKVAVVVTSHVIVNNPGGTNPGGSGRPPAGGFGSDRRLKKNIRAEGRIDHLNLTAYSWEYVNAPGERFYGVMAQDLLARKDLAHTVFTFQDGPFEGFYGVDYAALGLQCLTEDSFDGIASMITDGKVTLAA